MIFVNLTDSCHLKVCRLVCSKWNRLSVKQLYRNNRMKKKILKFDSDDKLQDFINTFTSSPNPLLLFSCFSFQGELNHVLLTKFFRKFPQQMQSLDFEHRLKDLKHLEDMLESQAKSLRRLIIHSWIEDFKIFSKKKIRPKSKNGLCLSNLVHLYFAEKKNNFKNYNVPELYLIEEHKQRDVHIELMAWVLSKIALDNTTTKSVPPRINLWNCKTMTRTVNTIEKFGFIKYLKGIIVETFHFGELGILTNAGVELDILILEPCPKYVDHDIGQTFTNEIYQCLENQINSLERLHYETRVFKFPLGMRALKKLSLNFYAGSYGEIVQIPVLYHQYFPNLEDLVLQSSEEESQTSSQFILQFLSPQEPCISLKRLRIYYVYLRAEIMENISSIFPKIKELAIACYCHGTDYEESLIYSTIWNSTFAETLEDLCLGTYWSLEFDETESKDVHQNMISLLSISDSLKLNSLFSGVKEDQIESLYRSLVLKNEQFDESKYNSILKLKNLKTLKMVTPFCQKHPFTDFSAFYIFGNMKKLQDLQLDEKLRRFSPKGIEYLRKKRNNDPISHQALISFSMYENDYELFSSTVQESCYEQSNINLLDDNVNVCDV